MRVRRSGTNFVGTFKIFSFHPHVHVYLAPFKLACRLQCIWLLRVKSVLLLDSCQTSSIELAKPQMQIQLNDHFCQNRSQHVSINLTKNALHRFGFYYEFRSKHYVSA